MKLELTGDVILYEFDNKHFVIGDIAIYQLDNALKHDMSSLSKGYQPMVYEVDDGLKNIITKGNGYELNTQGLYFEKLLKLIIHVAHPDHKNNPVFTVMNSNFEVQFTGNRFEYLFKIGTDIYILADGKCYKNMKEEGNYKFIKSYFDNRHKKDFCQNVHVNYDPAVSHSRDPIEYYGKIEPMNHFPGYSFTTDGIYDIAKQQKVPEVLFGIVKGHEFIKKPDRFIIQETVKESTIVSKKPIDITRSKIIEMLHKMDEGKLNSLLEALGKWT